MKVPQDAALTLRIALRHTWPTHSHISFHSMDNSLIIFHLCFVFCLLKQRHSPTTTSSTLHSLFSSFSRTVSDFVCFFTAFCPSCQTTQSSPFPTKLSAPCIKLAATAISIPIPRPKTGDHQQRGQWPVRDAVGMAPLNVDDDKATPN